VIALNPPSFLHNWNSHFLTSPSLAPQCLFLLPTNLLTGTELDPFVDTLCIS
jgi:hypothetical protein